MINQSLRITPLLSENQGLTSLMGNSPADLSLIYCTGLAGVRVSESTPLILFPLRRFYLLFAIFPINIVKIIFKVDIAVGQGAERRRHPAASPTADHHSGRAEGVDGVPGK
jgi:hypothetical protein